MKTAWLVKVDYKVPAMRGFSSYERAINYYNEMVNKVEEQIEERNYEKQETYSGDHKPVLTQFIYWNEDYTFRNTLGLVSIKQIEWEEE
ncbi:hypothetical protein [Enterococcus phage G01]|nr:hypothetical protein [Enterococcus phage G01]